MKLKPYGDTDFIAFVSLLNELATDFDGQATDEAAQLEYESYIDRDLNKQRVVVHHPEDASQLIGYADYFFVEETAEANLAVGVLKDGWGKGLEQKLFDWLVSQVKPLGAKTLNIYAPGNATELRRFLEAQGFEEAGAYRLLVLEPFTEARSFTLPDGYTLTSYGDTPNDALFIEANYRSLGDLWGHTASTEEAMREAWQFFLKHYEPKTLYLLSYHGAPAGCFKLRVTDNEGYLDAPGLVPEHRSTELYKTLALAGLEQLTQQCERVILETWGEPEEAIGAYEELGFEIDVIEIGYTRTLDS